jgi:hypothetical protein
MFLLVNEYRGNIDIINKPDVEDKKDYSTNSGIITSNNYMNLGANNNYQNSSIAPNSGNVNMTNTKTKNDNYEFRVHISPNDLEGVQIIWQMF